MSELLTLGEVAAILKCSPDTVTRKFAKLPGVVDVGSPENLKKHKRRYRVFRIPKSLLEKYLSEKAGHPVTVTSNLPLPTKPKKRRGKSRTWDEAAAHELARAVVDNTGNPTERSAFERIMRNARTLSFVPREAWKDVIFLEEEEDWLERVSEHYEE
jgi:hypothetical protein